MTPEHAHELGKIAADQLLTEAMSPVFDGSLDGILRNLESAAIHHAPSDGSAAFKSLFMRGAAEHFRSIFVAIEAHADAIEGAR
jgi:hypothetical protein